MAARADPSSRTIAVLASSGETAYVQASALDSYGLQDYREEPQHTSSLGGGGGGSRDGAAASQTDFSQVLSGLNPGELQAVLQQQPHLVQDLTAIAAGQANPDHLQFEYQMDSSESGIGAPKKKSKKGQTVYREQDRFLPIHNVARIMRNSIPVNGKVSKDAKECMQECVSEFISFITSEASDKCIQEKRKTITGDDILFAMATLGFDNYVEPLKIYLQKYREFSRSEKLAVNGGPRTGEMDSEDQLTPAGYPAIAPQPV